MSTGVELVTDRLRMRRMTEDDAGHMLAIWNDPGFVRFVGDRGIRGETQARRAMRDGILKLYADHGYGPYLLESLDGGSPMGICGLFKRENLDHPDLGYSLLPDFRGRGYALEAARAVLAHARDELGISEILAIVSPANTRSTQLLEKVGMTFRRKLRMPDDERDVALYGVSLVERQHG